jgi:hypothetical protein
LVQKVDSWYITNVEWDKIMLFGLFDGAHSFVLTMGLVICIKDKFPKFRCYIFKKMNAPPTWIAVSTISTVCGWQLHIPFPCLDFSLIHSYSWVKDKRKIGFPWVKYFLIRLFKKAV